MEAAALAGLVGLGYVVSRLTGTPKKREGFQNKQPGQDPYPRAGEFPMTFKPGSQTVALKSPPNSALALTPQGASAVAPSPELDQMYTTPNGRTYPAEPSPGPYGMPVGYATQQPPLAPPNPSPVASPAEMTIEDATAQVRLNPANIEDNPVYLAGDMVNSISGQPIRAQEFTHNNMVPFYGGTVKQNMRANANNSVLDTFTGAGYTQIAKREVETMFDYQRPFGNPFGLESSTDFIESRINEPRARNGERPFEPTRVGPGVGEGYGMIGKGGFQQFEVNEIMRPKTTEELRTVNNPKLSYLQPVVPGAHMVTNPADNPGEVRHYRPDRFYIDQTLSRAGPAGPAESVWKETSRPIQVLPDQNRSETSAEAFGPAAGQDTYQSYVAGSYRTPNTQQFGGAGYRNADATSWYTADVDSPEADYGRSSYENRPNERTATSERTVTLNTAPAETGQVSVHYLDDARPTRRAEQEDGHTEFGAGYIAGGAPAVTVWDPNDVARTTVKETTVTRLADYRGVAAAGTASAPSRLKVYDPKDIARPTQKAQLSNRQYYGTGGNNWGYMNEDFAYNMRTNPNKEQIARGRKPIAGNGGIAIFEGDPGVQTAKRLVSDDVNDRTNAVNRVETLPPGVGDLGMVKYRVPLRLDVAAERNTPDIVEAVDDNPLQQSLHRIAKIAAAQAAVQSSTKERNAKWGTAY
jgi:hypothetical protein